jgi:hypothetical protein
MGRGVRVGRGKQPEGILIRTLNGSASVVPEMTKKTQSRPKCHLIQDLMAFSSGVCSYRQDRLCNLYCTVL